MITRAFDPNDDARVVDLYARLHADDPTIDALDLDRFRALCAFAIFDDGRAFRVALDEGRIIALLTVGKMESPRDGGMVWRTRAFVDPSFRRRGIASSLFDAVERDARAERAVTLEAFVLSSWTAGRAFAAKRGFELHVHDLFLSRSLEPFEATAPCGISIRAFRGDRDAPIIAEIANATLSRDVGFSPENAKSIAGYVAHPGCAIFLAEQEGAALGFCHTDVRGRVGYVQAIGVLAKSEGRGIGAALLSRAIETLRVRDVERIELCTEKNNERAQRLYARAGFTFHRDALTLRKRL